jgi:DNA-directed RNA polymerase specialized sigma24 family protein
LTKEQLDAFLVREWDWLRRSAAAVVSTDRTRWLRGESDRTMSDSGDGDALLSLLVDHLYSKGPDGLREIRLLKGYSVTFMQNQTRWRKSEWNRERGMTGEEHLNGHDFAEEDGEEGARPSRLSQYSDATKKIATLDIFERALYDRYFTEGKPGTEIARITGMPVNNTYKMIKRVREKLGFPLRYKGKNLKQWKRS